MIVSLLQEQMQVLIDQPFWQVTQNLIFSIGRAIGLELALKRF